MGDKGDRFGIEGEDDFKGGVCLVGWRGGVESGGRVVS